MAKTIRGNTLTALMELVDGHTYDRDENGREEVTVRYVCQWASRLTLLPAVGTDASALGYSNLFLARTSFERDDAGQAIVTLVYRGGEFDFQGTPAPSYNLSGAGAEVPIQQHPAFASVLSDTWDEESQSFQSGSPYYGIQSFLVPGATWTKTFYRLDHPSEKDLWGLGKIDNPDGLLGVTPGHWILSNYSVSNHGWSWQHQKTWTYDPTPVGAWRVTIDNPAPV